MSDANSTPNQSGKTAVLGKNEEIPFTWPEGFNAVANSLQFLPEEERVPALTALATGLIPL
jgi:hypothetical protein